MKRISKPPEVRRQELLNTAMELFTQKGYEETSMGDIAKAAGVAQGLCYRYFDSKQKLFQEAMDQYVHTCCAGFLPVIHDRSKSIQTRLEEMARLILAQDQASPQSAFYHREDHQDLHQELSLKICRCLLPHAAQRWPPAFCSTAPLGSSARVSSLWRSGWRSSCATPTKSSRRVDPPFPPAGTSSRSGFPRQINE